MTHDFVELLQAFVAADVRFLIIGAYALSVHGHARATGDLHVWVEPASENATRVMTALRQFGAPLARVTAEDFSRPGLVLQLGLPPRRIDILTEVTGLTFAEAWSDRVQAHFGPCAVNVLSKAAPIKNKRALGRPQDLADVALLESDG